MRSLVVYESMFGNTHEVADRVGAALVEVGEVQVLSTGQATEADVTDAVLLVVGGPTHLHGMSRERSRSSAAEVADGDPDLELDDEAGGPGLRDWLKSLPDGSGRFFAAFDTRIDKPEILTGSAARGIARRLRHRGYAEFVEHESFVLDGNGPLDTAELDRVDNWGRQLTRKCKALNIV